MRLASCVRGLPGWGVALLGFLVVSVAARASGVEPLPSGRVRLGSFNIAWFSGKPGKGFVPRERRDVKRMARHLRGTHAHLLALQEILDEEALQVLTEELNRLARGQASWSYQDETGAVLLSPPGEREVNQSLAVIYDRKVVRVPHFRMLDELSGEKGKGLLRTPLMARVELVGQDLDFDLVNLHLKAGILAGWARERRTLEVDRLARWVSRERGGEDPDLVLLGDFNSPRDDATLRSLDELADQGEMVAVEDHLAGKQPGTHIPWEVGLDRILMSQSLFAAAGIEHSAWVYRFDDFLPGAHQILDFCTRSKYRVKDPEKRCDCSGAPAPGEGEESSEWAGPCEQDSQRWIRSPEFVRISDHRPVLWDLRLPRSPHSGKRSRKDPGRSRRKRR